MEKNNYESYEYLPDSENDHFFVVQDNGTFLVSRQAVEYTDQVQNDKSLETVQVFNVGQQQFLMDVENSSELISVSDQFIIPDGDSNLYANSFLIQPGTSAPSEPVMENLTKMEQNSSHNLAVANKEEESINLGMVAPTSKSCTEITLSDEQYQMLEQKGWLLLEISDKIYVLDSLGLHDITTNQKLIQKLKNENQSSQSKELDNCCKMDTGAENKTSQSIALESTPEFVIENNQEESKFENASLTVIKRQGDQIYEVVNSETTNITSSETNTETIHGDKQDNATNTTVFVIENEDIQRVGNTLKVKTKLSLRGFPDKIVLGKMANGKNLIAKVVKQPHDNELVNIGLKEPIIHLNNRNILDESEFTRLMQHFFRNNITKCNAEDVVTAESIVSQLLQIPSFKLSVLNNNLIITKTVQNEDSSGNASNKGLSALVTGKVSLIADQYRFIHLPHMLQHMVTYTEEFLAKRSADVIKKENFDILHVQISEAKQATTDVVRVSVTVNKRHIPILLISDRAKAQPNTVYACSFCATLFNSEEELKDHQTNDCSKHDEMLNKDKEEKGQPHKYCVITTGKTKSYACMQCDKKFNRLRTCKNHLKTHAPQDPNESAKSSTYGVYKCNMCTSTYFHPSTLSKHILARHINIKK